MAIRRSYFLVMWLAGCASAPPSPAASAPAVAEPRQLPAAIGAFERVGVAQLTPEDVVFNYRGPGEIHPQVFLYPISERTLRGGSTPAEQTRAEKQEFPEALLIAGRGRIRDLRLLGDSAVSFGDAPEMTGWHSSVRFVTNDVSLDSHQLLFVWRGRMLKVRTTFREGSAGMDELTGFVRSLITGQ